MDKFKTLLWVAIFATTAVFLNVGGQDCETEGTSIESCCNVTGCAWLNCQVDNGAKDMCMNESHVNVTACRNESMCDSVIETTTGNNPTVANFTETNENVSQTTAPMGTVTPMNDTTDGGNTSDGNVSISTADPITVSTANHSEQSTQAPGTHPTTVTGVVSSEPTTAGNSGSSSTSTVATTQSTGGCKGQHFDAASFVGGIVLCGGIITICFFVFKFYKSRQNSQRYHQF